MTPDTAQVPIRVMVTSTCCSVEHGEHGPDLHEPRFCRCGHYGYIDECPPINVDRVFAVLWTTPTYHRWANDSEPNQERRFRRWAEDFAAEYDRLTPPEKAGPA